MALTSPQEIRESLIAQGWHEGWMDWISTWLFPLLLLFLCFLTGTQKTICCQCKCAWGKQDRPTGKFYSPINNLGQMLTGEISLRKNPSEQEGAAVCWGTGTNHTSFTHVHFCLWKNFLQLVFPFPHVKKEILINFHSDTKNSISLFLNKSTDEVPSLWHISGKICVNVLDLCCKTNDCIKARRRFYYFVWLPLFLYLII